jgi:hypothetical protein
MIENNARPPFDVEKMQIFAEVFKLTYEEKTLMYDLAAREKNEVPADLEDILMYSDFGDKLRKLCRDFQNGDFEEEAWKGFIRDAYKEAKRREGDEDE